MRHHRLPSAVVPAALLLTLSATASAGILLPTLGDPVSQTRIYTNSAHQVTSVLGYTVDDAYGNINVGGNTGGAALYYFSLNTIPSNATITTVKINYQIQNPLIDSSADFYALAGQANANNLGSAIYVGSGFSTNGSDTVSLSTPVFAGAVPGMVSVLATASDPSGIFEMTSNPTLDVAYTTPAVPEPASLGLLGLGALALLRRRH